MRADTARLRALFEPSVEGLGYELVDVELAGPVLRVYIDSHGGINLKDCERVSRQLSAVLDVEDPIPGPYTLEVSSPGLDRPLVKREDFERFTGSLIKVKLAEPVQGRKNLSGRLTAVADERVVLATDTDTYELAFDNIDRARLVPEL